MDRVWEYRWLLLDGALVTTAVALLSLALATALGALAAAAKLSASRPARMAALAYSTLIRGVPDIVMILLLYLGGQRLVNAIARSFGAEEGFEISVFWAGVLSIGFIFGAYLSETFRGAYLAIPRGQIEAASAFGLTRRRAFTRIIAPQLVRFAIQGYGNTWQVLVKSTAVVSVIGLDDLVGIADKAGKSTREPFFFFLAVIFVYLAITSISGRALAAAERRAGRGT